MMENLQAYTANEVSGLNTSNRLSSPSSIGRLTTTSISTNSIFPLYTHFSSAALLACRIFFFVGVVGKLGLGSGVDGVADSD
jgi:hypothetical protein